MLRRMTKENLERFLTPNLIASTIVSLLSALSFTTYIILRLFHITSNKGFLDPLFLVGCVLATFAQILQITSLSALILQWVKFENKNTREKREVILLSISMIPYIPLLIMLVVITLYLWRKTHRASDFVDQATNAYQAIVDAAARQQKDFKPKTNH